MLHDGVRAVVDADRLEFAVGLPGRNAPARCARLATADTLVFLRAVLPPPPATVLEIGCGRGDLAASLADAGWVVAAIDADPDAVAEARRRGVAAIHADLLDFAGGPFEAVIFTRSLHHISDLTGAIGAAGRLAGPGAVVAVEDFDWSAADGATAAWYYGLRAALRGIVDPEGEPPPLDGPACLAAWRHEHEHDHPLHVPAAMRAALRSRFRELGEARGAYLYRWFESRARLAAGPVVGAGVAALERASIGSGQIRPVGWRWWGSVSGSPAGP